MRELEIDGKLEALPEYWRQEMLSIKNIKDKVKCIDWIESHFGGKLGVDGFPSHAVEDWKMNHNYGFYATPEKFWGRLPPRPEPLKKKRNEVYRNRRPVLTKRRLCFMGEDKSTQTDFNCLTVTTV